LVSVLTYLEDLENLLGRKLPRDRDKLNEILYSVKCEVANSEFGNQNTKDHSQEETELQIENVDTNRPDTWSTEGIARALRGILEIETGLKKYKTSTKIATEITVDKELREIRPYIACTVAYHAKISDSILRGLVQLQEKLDLSYGRRRKRSSIGFYDFDLITPPLRYGIEDPDKIRFVPLDGNEALSLREILQQHPKGIEYGQILEDHQRLPILMDSKQKVLSFPPIINSNDLGKLTPDTRNILVEVTGTNETTVLNCLTILATTLADRGAQLRSARIHYKYTKTRATVTPRLNERTIKLPIEQTKKLIGVDLTKQQIISLLKRSRYDVRHSDTRTLTVAIPCYRLDILHPNDVIEDVAIAYGLNRIEPRWPIDLTVGNISELEKYSDKFRELAIGFGFQEVLTFMMTNEEKIFTKMQQPPVEYVRISNPKVQTLTCLRPWLLPSLLEFLSNNTHVQYPQKLFEVGDCTAWDESSQPKDYRKLCCVSAHARANFTEMKSILQTLLANLGFDFAIQSTNNASYLDGRAATISVNKMEVGMIGEVHPRVIRNWNLENPVVAMELNISTLLTLHDVRAAPQLPTSERAN
jgi:phenylalanyl-tRNA synthetase beta chain